MRITERISDQESILDLGCGNGQLAKHLISEGHQALYTGLDSNAIMLDIASIILPEKAEITLLQRDLAAGDWDEHLPADSYDIIFAFAVLHHIPGYESHRLLVAIIGDLLLVSSLFVLGGEFWDKVRALFIRDARVVLTGSPPD